MCYYLENCVLLFGRIPSGLASSQEGPQEGLDRQTPTSIGARCRAQRKPCVTTVTCRIYRNVLVLRWEREREAKTWDLWRSQSLSAFGSGYKIRRHVSCAFWVSLRQFVGSTISISSIFLAGAVCYNSCHPPEERGGRAQKEQKPRHGKNGGLQEARPPTPTLAAFNP